MILPKRDLVKLSFLLFLFVFGVRQVIDVLTYVYLLSGWLQHFVYILAQMLFAVVSILLTKVKGGGFRDHGFLIPDDLSGCLSISLFLALVYVLTTIFLPGSLMGFEAFPPASISYFSLEVLNSLLASFAIESVFRGYIQTNLTKAYGFFPALCISSVMSAVHNFSFVSFSYSYTKPDIVIVFYTLSFFTEGIFLGFFFQRTNTLVCPIVFGTVASPLYRFTPLKVPQKLMTEHMSSLFKVIAYIILVPLVQFLLAKRSEMLQR